MKPNKDIAMLFVRITLAATFLSAVASRLNLWGAQSSGWENFLKYSAQVNSFAPAEAVPYLAIMATILETSFGLLLFIGYQTRRVALGAAGLTLLFALAMAYSFGIKSPLDYSVFVDSAAALLLSTASKYRWSLDDFLEYGKNKS